MSQNWEILNEALSILFISSVWRRGSVPKYVESKNKEFNTWSCVGFCTTCWPGWLIHLQQTTYIASERLRSTEHRPKEFLEQLKHRLIEECWIGRPMHFFRLPLDGPSSSKSQFTRNLSFAQDNFWSWPSVVMVCSWWEWEVAWPWRNGEGDVESRRNGTLTSLFISLQNGNNLVFSSF